MRFPALSPAYVLAASVLTALAALSGCSSNPDIASARCAVAADCPPGEICSAGVCTAAPSDYDGGRPDAQVPDAGASLGAPCDSDPDCASGVCLLSASAGKLCSVSCADEACPLDYACALAPDREDLGRLCVPFLDLYCRTCQSGEDCAAEPAGRCARLSGAVAFCLRNCASRPCPADHECLDVATTDVVDPPDGGPAAALRLCVPRDRLCPGCVDLDGDGFGVGRDCLGSDCDDSKPSTFPGAPERCNGVDDDCDGIVDDGFDLNADPENCGACGVRCVPTNASAAECVGGVCRFTCLASFHDCDRQPQNGCEVDLEQAQTCGNCAADEDCPPTFYCAVEAQPPGTCVPRKADAASCTPGSTEPGRECRSGHCVDGVCCATACEGPCLHCALPDSPGRCLPVAAGEDPRADCSASARGTCGLDGECDGAGACRLWEMGTICDAQACLAGIEQSSRLCNGAGGCGAATLRSCVPYRCNAAGSACLAACTSAADCVTGFTCAPDGTCRRSDGVACAAQLECASGFCADGVCCQSACDGVCERCDLAGRAGFCDPIAAASDPDNECPDDGAASCGRMGACTGARSCALYAAGTACAAASCSGGVSNLADSCDGSGHCVDGGTQACLPFTCNAGTGLCRTTCGSSADCQAGFTCAPDSTCKKATGGTCGAASECASGFCADGVCCQSACDGVCERCDLTGRAGHCDPIPAALDPDNECPDDGAASCGRLGACSGGRTCALYSAGTVCAAASCSGGVSNLADTCDGSGHCVDGGTQACLPFTCNAGTGLCRMACGSSADCQAGFACASGACKKATGTACGAGSECASGFCADGVCCQSACDGVCERCDLAGRAGYCDPIATGTDPDAECPDEGAASCGRLGVCSGARSCALYAAGTVCAAASCSGGVSNLADTCDGSGHCVDGGTQACSPFTCNPGTGLCRTTCGSSGDCQAGYNCAPDSTCKVASGSVCGTGSQCASGFCADGVCCQSACSGVCERCDLPSRAGYCDPIAAGADPDNECQDQGAGSCSRTGVCSGARSCALYAAGTVCAAASCSGGVSNLADTCDGSGHCVDGGTQACSPFACNAGTGLCRTTCGSSTECQTGFACAGGTCMKATGGVCSVGGECASGFCTDGVCCQSACSGVCERCDLPGRAGYCDPIAAASDPDNECQDEGAASCRRNGACSGARSCALYATGTVCAAASCSGGVSNIADTCDGSGHCVDGGAQACLPFTCNSGTGLCRTTCGSSADCQAGFACAGGACRKATGGACGAGSECASGFCADGVCCQSACGGICESCALPGRAGYCDPIASGTDPDAECPDDGAASCGRMGLCSGARSCAIYAAGAVCAAASCSGGVSNLADTCDGSGHCVDRGTQACLPFTCNAGTGLCRTTCGSGADCQAGYVCNISTGQCMQDNGPDAGVAGPDGGIADPDGGIAGPDGGIAGPDAGIANPDAGIANPDGGASPPTTVAQALQRLSTRTVFFHHRSVGWDIVAGVQDFLALNPGSGVSVISTLTPSVLQPGVFAHADLNSANGSPVGKIADFDTAMRSGLANVAQIAFMKFCFADFDASTNVNALFATYSSTLTQLKADYPSVQFVHVTAPLTIFDDPSEIKREAYNTLLRNAYAGSEPVFDLAMAEATCPNGTVTFGSTTGVLVLCPDNTYDGGHLNVTGRQSVAKSLLLFLASLP